MRLRADIWVSAFLRRCNSASLSAVLRRRGAAEAGAIFVKIDRLDGTGALFGPAPQTETAERGADRLWHKMHQVEWIEIADIEAAIAREIKFDPDLWIIEIDDKDGRHFLDTTDA
jgi:hypothetical protein